MSSADGAASQGAGDAGRVGANPRRIGAWCGGIALLSSTSILPLWIFGEADIRRTGILIAMAIAFLSLVAAISYRRLTGGPRSFHAVSTAEFLAPGTESEKSLRSPSMVPLSLPSRRGVQCRVIGWYVGFFTVVVTLIALAAGSPERPEMLQRLHDAGPEFTEVVVEKVGEVERHDPSRGKDFYAATVVVRLVPRTAAGAAVTATVRTDTPEPLAPGDKVTVLYAPSRPEIGAIAGDESRLGAFLRGDTMSPRGVWGYTGAWVIAIGFSVWGLWVRYGFRSFSRMREGDLAVRVRFMGTDHWRQGTANQRCLRLTTSSSKAVHFLTYIAKREVPEGLEGQELWLCWDGRRGTGGHRFSPRRASAALVSDDGWVLHALIAVEEAEALVGEHVSIKAHAVTEANPSPVGAQASEAPEPPKRLFLWDPRSAWPRFVSAWALALSSLLFACGVALLSGDLSGTWRWLTGLGGVVVALALAHVLTMRESLLAFIAMNSGGGSSASEARGR